MRGLVFLSGHSFLKKIWLEDGYWNRSLSIAKIFAGLLGCRDVVFHGCVFSSGLSRRGKTFGKNKDLLPIPPEEVITGQGINARFVDNYQLIRAN
jgi:hypothetical protein